MRQQQITVKLTGIGINNRECAARCVGRGDGRRDSDRDVHKVRQRFGGIQRFTAADTQYGATLTFFGDGAQPVDLILRTFAAKRGDFY
ncbi:Uncharacterised protein [Salmonella enterica subsp. enterica serovar Typhimurium str. DT104]|nr:Uncharacterised protein [Salmonella enterica subsp. enterica serovar Typhimurium str. DT104]